MARTRAPGRLDEIAESALKAFMSGGYRRTRMSDVARAAGVSPGLLYTYAESKEALFLLVLLRETGTDVDSLELPVSSPEDGDLRSVLRKGLQRVGIFPTLDAALQTDSPPDARAELAAIVGEHYDGVLAHRRVIRLVEQCAADWPELATLFYDRGRKGFVHRLGEYIRRRAASGQFRQVADPDVAARFVIETVAWFANHRYGDHDGAGIADDVARATVVDLLTAGLTGDSP